MEVTIILLKRKPVLWPSSFGSQRACNKREHVCLAALLMHSKKPSFPDASLCYTLACAISRILQSEIAMSKSKARKAVPARGS